MCFIASEIFSLNNKQLIGCFFNEELEEIDDEVIFLFFFKSEIKIKILKTKGLSLLNYLFNQLKNSSINYTTAGYISKIFNSIFELRGIQVYLNKKIIFLYFLYSSFLNIFLIIMIINYFFFKI